MWYEILPRDFIPYFFTKISPSMSTKSYSVTAFLAINCFLNSKIAPMIIKSTLFVKDVLRLIWIFFCWNSEPRFRWQIRYCDGIKTIRRARQRHFLRLLVRRENNGCILGGRWATNGFLLAAKELYSWNWLFFRLHISFACNGPLDWITPDTLRFF